MVSAQMLLTLRVCHGISVENLHVEGTTRFKIMNSGGHVVECAVFLMLEEGGE